VHVRAAVELRAKRRELEVVRREEREAAVALGEPVRDRPRERQASNVDVPRPISSISTRLSGVARLRMYAASVISTMKVERPPARSSAAPIRV